MFRGLLFRLGLLAALLCLPASASEDAGAFLLGPYVNSVTTKSAKIVWVSVAQAPRADVVVQGGGRTLPVAVDRLNVAGRTELRHVATATELRVGTRYEYRITCGEEAATGSFRTAPSPGAPVRFVVYGDSRTRPRDHARVAWTIAEQTPDFVLHTGDLVGDGTVWDQWGPQFFEPATSFLDETVLWPVRGNHEGDAVFYRELFELPGNELYYSFDYGDVHCVVLDTEAREERREEMLRWLERDLAGSDARWTLVAYHVPTFNVGGHGSAWGREDFLPVMERHGVDFVLTGHSHLYERFLPIGPPGGKPVFHLVTGGGGAPRYPARPSPILVDGRGISRLHLCVFQVDGDRLEVKVLGPEGDVFDTLRVVKRDGRYQHELMQQAVHTEVAKDLAFAFVGLRADFPEAPEPGGAGQVTLRMPELPEGVTGELSPTPDARWTFPPQRLQPGQREVTLPVAAPDEFRVHGDSLEPPLTVRMTLQFAGRRHESDGLSVRLSEESLRRMSPEPEPVRVGSLPTGVNVDGRTGDWEGVAPLPLPFHDGAPGAVRLAWSKEGIYGLVEADDASVEADPEQPWEADSLEVFVDKALSRSLTIHEGTAQYVFSPAPKRGPGPGHALVAHGVSRAQEKRLSCAWRPREGGYVMEFLVPHEFLHPARMQPGTRIGLNFTLNDDGRPVQQFYCDKRVGGWRTPLRWGVVELTK